MYKKSFGFAAKKMKKVLNKQGREIVVEPEGFLVDGIKGPLLEGEEERAAKWGKSIVVNK